ncbi:MAG TPA: flagellin, partial [Bradyrhizobium sp.]
MSSIVLSSSVRQNLLSLQSTADLLAQTQNRLSTGKSVNSALDNPTNFFTAQSLDNRASDINNLLDSIGNGVQVLQSANTGLTSLQKLVDTAKSIATQALQSTVGYSTKAGFSTTITGATANNLLGTGAATDATAVGSVQSDNQTQTYTASTGIGTAVTANHQAAFTDTPYTLGTALHTGTGGAVALSTDTLNTLTNGASATLTGPTAG